MPETFMVEDAQIIYRNFSGEESQFNRKGDRNFAVILEPDVAEKMAADGWAVKFYEPGEEGETRNPIIKVKVGYKFRPPKVVMITSTARTNLTEDTVGVLDWADIVKVDLIAQASHWDVGGKQGIAAYLKTMFVTVEEDELEKKYAIEESLGE